MFFRIISLTREAPLFHFAPTIDVDFPQSAKICEKSLVMKLFRKGLVMGRWKESGLGPDESLMAFMRCGLSPSPGQYERLAAEDDRRLVEGTGGRTSAAGDDRTDQR